MSADSKQPQEKQQKTQQQDTGLTFQDYDWAGVGHRIAAGLLAQKGWNLGGNRFQDYGWMTYNDDKQSFAGAGGCASSALMNPVSHQQGESILGIAYTVTLESDVGSGGA